MDELALVMRNLDLNFGIVRGLPFIYWIKAKEVKEEA
jgi:hypothetical protein